MNFIYKPASITINNININISVANDVADYLAYRVIIIDMGKTVLITGGAGGWGEYIALALSGRGWRVVLNYRTSEAIALSLSERIPGLLLCKADVGELSQVISMERFLREKVGELNAVVNNAGVSKDNLLLKTSEADWDETMRVNLKGPFNIIKTFAPLLEESGGGHILNVSSYSGLKGKEGQPAYSASKSALLGLTVSAARELADMNIRVNAILPGFMPVGLGQRSEKAMAEAKGKSLLGELSDPKEAAIFLSEVLELKNVTGQVFSIDSRI